VFQTGGSAITSGSAPFTGTYAPEEAFTGLSGTANGTWTLSVYDDAGGDGGYIDDWSISLSGGSITSINPTFNEIVVNGGDVTLAQDVDVTTTLTLTSGDIITSSSNKLNLENTAASALTTGSASSMIVGPFDRKTNSTDDYLLPVGDGTKYRPVVITPSATTATTYTAEFKNTAHSSISYDANGYNNTACTVPNDLDHVAMGCWWDIERTTSGSDCYVALNWDATCGVDLPDDIVLAHYNGSSWDKIGSTLTDNTGSGSATAANGRVKSDLFVGDFSPFNLGSGTGDGNSLPIDLLSFHTECSHDIVDVNFSVVSQVNNEKFLIERSTDAVEWEVVGDLPGVPGGNSNTQMDYVFTDNNPLANLSYYRLTQVDFDGKAKTFYPVSSSCGSTVGGLPVDVYPNPAWNDVTIEFELDQYQGDDVYYTITDATGKTVMSDYLELNKGFNKNTLDINRLPKGIYILRFNQTKDHITETRIVKR
ncbi:MAG: T9SS type A sorting domain-containing protein, partial [Flavobacteriales bacterium]|nr:T9SS type A sorting domain-containing protein [Flavobacteriales bacterium]